MGKQELEIRVGNDHIAFEVGLANKILLTYSLVYFYIDREDWVVDGRVGK